MGGWIEGCELVTPRFSILCTYCRLGSQRRKDTVFVDYMQKELSLCFKYYRGIGSFFGLFSSVDVVTTVTYYISIRALVL